ncbi:unnamed protein product [Malus baccata var. baccata]
MSGPFDRRFDLNLGEEASMPSPENIWHSSFISPTGPLTIGDSVLKNDMTVAVVARNLVTPKDNRLLSKRSDELAIKDSLALSVQCAVCFVPFQVLETKCAKRSKMEHFRAKTELECCHLPSSSRAVPRNEAPNDQPPMPPPSGAPPTAEAPPTTEISPEQPL